MLVILAGKAGVLADHDGLAGVDVPEHPDDENGLAVVTLVVTGKYAPLCHAQPSLRRFSYSITQIAAKEKCGARTEKTEIWENSKHIRCPDTRRFLDNPKPL